MYENEIPATGAPKRIPWNKDRLVGPRPPLRQKHVWAIRTRLQIDRQVRDLALFNLAIDSKLRRCASRPGGVRLFRPPGSAMSAFAVAFSG